MKDADLDDIAWHDALILYVHLVPENDSVEMRLLLPESERQKGSAEESIIFDEAYGYKEFEGPFEGAPTVLSASVSDLQDGWSLIKLETNAGYRELWCKDVYYKARRNA